ncbi:MAG TPA: hypothetical protein VK821_00835, partial [Dehalococcoidia bacterium]|nr:hypothetical protein [Dehalococcoidia bacterium]
MALKRLPRTNGHESGVDLKAHASADVQIPNSNFLASGTQRLIDPALFADPYAAANFIGNVLEASTETSIIGTDLEGNIQLWNEGARRLYGYEPE